MLHLYYVESKSLGAEGIGKSNSKLLTINIYHSFFQKKKKERKKTYIT